VRTYVDPVMEHRERIDLVVDTARRNQVSGLAQHAEAVLSALGKRFTRVNPATVATLWVADDERQGRAISGGQPRPELDALGWTNQSGDVVLDWSKLSSSTRSDVRSTVRHELAHVALRREIGVAPPVLLEGIAVAAELDPALDGGDRSADLRPLVAAFNAGNVGLTQLLRADPKQPFANGQSAPQVATSYLAGYATVMWLREEYGADADARLLGQLANGVAIDDALENIAQGDAPSVSRRVAAWTRNEVAST
jgi:hypothetical protein